MGGIESADSDSKLDAYALVESAAGRVKLRPRTKIHLGEI
jgi:hypothetical protein